MNTQDYNDIYYAITSLENCAEMFYDAGGDVKYVQRLKREAKIAKASLERIKNEK